MHGGFIERTDRETGMTSYVGPNHASYPYSAVTYVEVTFPDGTQAVGSGAVIGQNDVLTASHVIFSAANGGLADEITVYPGRDGNDRPYGSYEAGWADYFEVDLDNDNIFSRQESEDDVAVLGFDAPFGETTGWFGIDHLATSGSFNLTGYPTRYGDASGPRMTNDQGRVEAGRDAYVWDLVGLEAGPGNSGGPLWYESEGAHWITGVLATEQWATDVYAQFDTIRDWVDGNDFLLSDGQTPMATDDTVSTPAGTARTIDVLANDSDPNGDPLSLTGVTDPANGGTLITANGQVRYTPDAGFAGTDSFTYTISDGADGSDSALVTVQVTAPIDQPTIRADGSGDFNGDGTDDILWQNATNGRVGQFQMNDGNKSWDFISRAGNGYEFAGTGDFNGDGTDDVLWTNPNNNRIGQFEMTDGDSSWQPIGRSGPNYEAVGTGDFNGDGTDDILWINSVNGRIGQHEMSDGNGSWDFIGRSGGNFEFSGTGDFNGDGTDDLFWYDSSTGRFGQHQMSDGNASWDALGTAGGNFVFAGTGDFDGDGSDELLWLNRLNGQAGFHDVRGGGVVWNALGTAGRDAIVAGTGDYDGDGADEILSYNRDTGRTGQFEIDAGAATWLPISDSTGAFAPLINQIDDGMVS